jgi:hypothetical protein
MSWMVGVLTTLTSWVEGVGLGVGLGLDCPPACALGISAKQASTSATGMITGRKNGRPIEVSITVFMGVIFFFLGL